MSDSSRDMMRQARQDVIEWSAVDVGGRLARGEPLTLVDVRETVEWNDGHIPDAVHVPRGFLEMQIEAAGPDKDAPVVLYCASGVPSVFAAKTLPQMGYRQPLSMAGRHWARENASLPSNPPRTLPDESSRG